MGYKKDDKCLEKAFDDEKLFVLMARDIYAPYAVMEWIKASIFSQPDEKLREAFEAALEMKNRCGEFQGRRLNEKYGVGEIEEFKKK